MVVYKEQYKTTMVDQELDKPRWWRVNGIPSPRLLIIINYII